MWIFFLLTILVKTIVYNLQILIYFLSIWRLYFINNKMCKPHYYYLWAYSTTKYFAHNNFILKITLSLGCNKTLGQKNEIRNHKMCGKSILKKSKILKIIMGTLYIKNIVKILNLFFIFSELKLQSFHENSQCFKSPFISLKHPKKTCGQVFFCFKNLFFLSNIHQIISNFF
jgi:hypothetical protein